MEKLKWHKNNPVVAWKSRKTIVLDNCIFSYHELTLFPSSIHSHIFHYSWMTLRSSKLHPGRSLSWIELTLYPLQHFICHRYTPWGSILVIDRLVDSCSIKNTLLLCQPSIPTCEDNKHFIILKKNVFISLGLNFLKNFFNLKSKYKLKISIRFTRKSSFKKIIF